MWVASEVLRLEKSHVNFEAIFPDAPNFLSAEIARRACHAMPHQ
jgi:hypothetical protein